MKPSHTSTPRTLADCNFQVGYTYRPISDRPSLIEFIVYGLIGLAMMGGMLALMLAYFDVLVK